MTKSAMFGFFIPDLTINQLFGRLKLYFPIRPNALLEFDYNGEKVRIDLGGANQRARQLEKFLQAGDYPLIDVVWGSVVDHREISRQFKHYLKPFGFNTVAITFPVGERVGLPQYEQGIQISVGYKTVRGEPQPDHAWLLAQYAELINTIAMNANVEVHKLRCFNVTREKDVCTVSGSFRSS